MHLKTGLIFLIICLALQVQGSREIPNKINSAEAKHLAVTSGSDKTEKTTKWSKISTIRRIFDMAKHRTKRSSFFSTGVKVCPQESVKQILASHQAYYRLRVCQEAVWEAFRIFLDRIPDTSEYQNWVTACQRETFCIFDISKNFSNSQEHLEIIQRRVKHRTFQERKDEISAEKTGGKKVEEIPSISTGSPRTLLSPNGTLLNEIFNDTKTPVKELGTNAVPELPVEQMVEFSVTLTDQEYTAELSDPNSPEYQQLAAKFQLQMKKIFEKLPGFKEIRVLGFKQKKEKDGSSSTVARYVVNFERDGSETKGTADDISTIGSNKVESEKIPISPVEEGEISAAKLTVTDLQQLVATALHEDQSLPVDLGTLQFTDETIIPPSDIDNDIQGVVTVPLAGPDLEELPLGYPSPATVDQRGDVFGDKSTTESPALSEEISIPEEFNNFITSEPDFPTKPSREPFQDRYPHTQIIATDHPSFTVPFSALGSTSTPPKSEDSYLPPPADDSAGKDFLTDGYESPVELATTGSFTTLDLLHTREADSEAEEKQELTDLAEPPFEDVDQDSPSGQAVKIMEELESSGDDIFVTASTYDTLPVFTGPSHVSTVQPGAVITDVLPSIAPLPAATSPSYSPSEIIEQSLELPDSSVKEGVPEGGMGEGVQDITAELDLIGATSTAGLYEGEQGSGFISVLTTEPAETTPAPVLKYVTTSSMTTAAKGKELVVFFSLRVTNMHFSDDLFNRSSTEYKALEQQFMQLLLPYLQSNLTGFKHLEILNFRNGSVIVNSKMKFARTVPYNITEAVHCVLEDFCDAAAQHLNLEIDSYSLDIEPADRADPCKFMACDKFSECIMNEWTKEADCLCKPGYASQDGLPCRSLCELEPHLCVNGGKCELVPGRGAVCRCPVRRHQLYQGQRCAKFGPEPIQPFSFKPLILGLGSLGFLFIILIIKIRRKCKRNSNLQGPTLSSCNSESAVRINPAFEHDEPLSSFCHTACSVSACLSSSEILDHEALQDLENTIQPGGHQMSLRNQD
ncbi:interphotoreceptor matrix proteoglycan 1 isoform X1 [Corvus moneduloides]|uniref:Interphotoreceptor matrix proteoglycan 1 n=1 Tax=Corvus moneduloides TaxID=1196302 RepID=A0A8C3D9C9_CORMO|nr:interphotoreceptor matrix proteoglycan 1 isoform X1 [Corvus moneduloides]XP_031960748.1 interphotoreceptor matrix proteoglycan 1 isoform X1 [Corvus moneduloides]XP_031960750.1 interphotoreceptor matrix proteoglycan 1 isoform X1 [Corvus moneduloides]